MFCRRLLPLVRASQRCMVPVRGLKRNLPIAWPFRRKSLWDDPFPDVFRSSYPFRAIDDFFKENMERMMQSVYENDYRLRSVEGANAEIVEAKCDKQGLSLQVNVSHFKPEELNVKLVNDRLIISGKHTQKADEHGFVSREFTREFILPETIDQDTLASKLTDAGHLVITARLKPEAEQEGRTITIEKDSGEKKTE